MDEKRKRDACVSTIGNAFRRWHAEDRVLDNPPWVAEGVKQAEAWLDELDAKPAKPQEGSQ